MQEPEQPTLQRSHCRVPTFLKGMDFFPRTWSQLSSVANCSSYCSHSRSRAGLAADIVACEMQV
jgi:hypothetical protein